MKTGWDLAVNVDENDRVFGLEVYNFSKAGTGGIL